MSIIDAKFYENEIRKIEQELKELPDGYLVKRQSRYYVKSGTVEKGVTKDQPKIRQLARKAYLLQRLRHLEWNCALVEKISGRYKTENPIEIIRGLSSCCQTLPINYFFHPFYHEQTERVADKYECQNVRHPEGLIYLTNSGIRVRSKSERTIADTLNQKGIIYRYEAELALGGVSINPDFTIFRPFDGKMILWEHLGLMDDDGYRHKTVEKLALYARYGFFPLGNLICTYEQDLLNPARIHALIDVFLLSI